MNERVRISRRPVIAPRGLNKVEAATYLGIGVTSLDKLIEQGIITKIRYPEIDKDVFDRLQLDGVIDRAVAPSETVPTLGPTSTDKHGFLRAARGEKRNASH